ncbi:peptidyl-prolyl cis-trans isomerase [Herbaspirillum sp.]|uniref:peptidyl-prolyl cis-trans isomerase n=1 Tax=Herbaspirillum sp. TaxID=1890675 RepID=UPI00257C28DF|nr:peptidyl-prolyl cis-trans isomerase [Herbaspirillum sp.]
MKKHPIFWKTLYASVLLSPTLLFAQVIDKTPLPAGAAAVVNGKTIPESQVQEALKATGLPPSDQLRSAVKSQLIARELFRQQAAKNAALENRPEVKKAMQEAKDAAMIQLYLRDAIKPPPVTEEMIREQFNTIISSLGPSEYKARLIQVEDNATAQKIIEQLKTGSDFAQLAAQYSVAANKNNGGELAWVSFKLPAQEGKTQNLPLPVAQAIAELTPGAVTPVPVLWNNQRFVIRLDQLRPTQIPQYDDVKAALRQTMERKALEEATLKLVGDLTSSAKVQQ